MAKLNVNSLKLKIALWVKLTVGENFQGKAFTLDLAVR